MYVCSSFLCVCVWCVCVCVCVCVRACVYMYLFVTVHLNTYIGVPCAWQCPVGRPPRRRNGVELSVLTQELLLFILLLKTVLEQSKAFLQFHCSVNFFSLSNFPNVCTLACPLCVWVKCSCPFTSVTSASGDSSPLLSNVTTATSL